MCELNIPKIDNLIVLKKDYNNEYDIGTYRYGIEYIEEKENNKIYDLYSFCF